MKLSSNSKLTKKEQRIINNDLYVINENITFESGAIDVLRKFLHEIKLENIEGGESVD